MMKVQLVADHGVSHSAWTKAPADVAKIADELGFVRVVAGRVRLGNFSFIRRVLRKLCLEHFFDRVCWGFELASLRRRFGRDGGELLLQHPLPYSWTFDIKNLEEIGRLKKHGIKVTVFVHDIGALRGSSAEVGGVYDHIGERRLFELADKIIVHNSRMRDFVAKMGIRGQVVVLDIFDYLVSPSAGLINASDCDNRSVLLAGGFAPAFAKYASGLKDIKTVQWVLFGYNYDESRMGGANVRYCGEFEASCPPVDCKCRFGLVWNGESIDTCAGVIGEYLRYCNNHKLSLYLSMGLPVIVWREAAIAEFVERNHVGVTVSSLREIPSVLDNISENEYKLLLVNASHIAKSLRVGANTRRVLSGV